MRTWNEEKKQWVGMKGNELCEGSRICKCSLIAGNTVPNPECPVHVVAHDSVNHPKHYTSHPSGVECITVTEHMNFNIGNAIKYLWRADHKNGIEDLRKAAWYINREIQRQTAVPAPQAQPKWCEKCRGNWRTDMLGRCLGCGAQTAPPTEGK